MASPVGPLTTSVPAARAWSSSADVAMSDSPFAGGTNGLKIPLEVAKAPAASPADPITAPSRKALLEISGPREGWADGGWAAEGGL
jgi:hypothetical protein